VRRVGKFFDRDAGEYFRAAGISSWNEKVAANTCIQRLKAGGFWDELTCCYLVSPQDITAALVCAKTLTSMTNVGGVHSSLGISSNGIDRYLNTGIVGSSISTDFKNLHMDIYLHDFTINPGLTSTFIGCGGATKGVSRVAVTYADATQTMNFAFPLSNSSNTYSSLSQAGFHSFCAINGGLNNSFYTMYFNGGVQVLPTSVANTATAPSPTIFIGALGDGSSGVQFSNQTFSYAAFGQHTTAANCYNYGDKYYQIIQDYQAQLGRAL
jgi:hypothetical protein